MNKLKKGDNVICLIDIDDFYKTKGLDCIILDMEGNDVLLQFNNEINLWCNINNIKPKYKQRYVVFIIKNNGENEFYGNGDWDYIQEILESYVRLNLDNTNKVSFRIIKEEQYLR